MKSLNIFALFVALNTGGWIAPQEIFGQQVSVSNQLVCDEVNPYGSWVDYPNFGYVWVPNLFPGFEHKLSSGFREFVPLDNDIRPVKSYINTNDGNVYWSYNDNAESNTAKPTKVVLLPVVSGYTVERNSEIYNEEQVYTINPAVDIPIVAVGTIWSVYALSKIYTKTSPTAEEIQGLNKNNIPAFDRWAIYPYNKNMDNVSYYPFYASMPLPLLFFISNEKTSKDFFKLGLLYWETMAIVGILGTSGTYFIDRFRPYCYTSETPMDVRTGKVAINSFFSGHVEMVAAPTFFIAKVYSDYYPESKIKWVFYGFAASITVATSYLRLRGGEHFPSDIILGAVIGALAGILVPEFHKNNNSDVSILPYSSEMAKGLALIYQF